MITRKVNGKETKIPTNWGDICFSQYIEILKLAGNPKADYMDTISICLSIPREQVAKMETDNVFELLNVISFTNIPAVIDLKPKSILNYLIPKDITLESLSQFENMRIVMSNSNPKEGDTDIEKIVRITEAYPTYAAIYCQKIRDGVYDYDKAMEMVPEMWRAPALEILSAGNFFLISLSSSFSSTTKTSLQRVPVWRRSRLVLAELQRTGAFIKRWIISLVKPMSKKTSF